MKLVKNLVFALVLASVLAISAPAGELQTPGAASTPSPTPQLMMSDDGTVVYETNAESTETSDTLLYDALAALLSMY